MCVLRLIMASAVLGVFSVVLRAVGDFLGRLFPSLGGLPGAHGRLQCALGASWKLPWVSLGAILPSHPVTCLICVHLF